MLVSTNIPNRFRSAADNTILEMVTSVVSFSVQRLQKLRASQYSWTSSLIGNFSDGVVMFDLNRSVKLANRAAEPVVGSAKIKHLEAVYPVFSSVDLKKEVDLVLAGKKKKIIVEVELADAYYEVTVIPIHDEKDDVIGGAIIFHDIRDMKQIDKIRSDFMSIAAHDLRSPISAIKGFTQMIRHGNYGKAPTGKIGDALQFIEEGTDRMISLINDFLTVTRINQGKFSVDAKPVHIEKTIKMAADEITLMIKDRPIEVAYLIDPKLPLVMADEMKIIQVLINLMDNALKHMEQGVIDISATLSEDKNHVVISEHNSGEPIPEEDMPKIFNQYYKGSSKELAPGRGGGLGLGLSIVKMIVEAHNGTITAENTNPGVTFSFTLPIAEK